LLSSAAVKIVFATNADGSVVTAAIVSLLYPKEFVELMIPKVISSKISVVKTMVCEV
jgi:hypothetical protein